MAGTSYTNTVMGRSYISCFAYSSIDHWTEWCHMVRGFCIMHPCAPCSVITPELFVIAAEMATIYCKPGCFAGDDHIFA